MRWNGESHIDVTLATPPAARMIRGWRVEASIETLSDHQYIFVEVDTRTVVATGQWGGGPRRWALKKLDKDRLNCPRQS